MKSALTAFRNFRTLCRTGIVKHFLAEQLKAGATIHLPLDELEPINLAFGLTIQANRQLYLILRMKRTNLRSPIRSTL